MKPGNDLGRAGLLLSAALCELLCELLGLSLHFGREVPDVSPIGSESETAVPQPGSLEMSSVPPARLARSRIPAIPQCPQADAASMAPEAIPCPSSRST
jgi:hypothetical protein